MYVVAKVGSGAHHLCGGGVYPKWQLLHEPSPLPKIVHDGVAMLVARINTTMCNFGSTPVYVANLVVLSQNWSFTGSHVLSNSSVSYFDIVIAANSVTGNALLADSSSWKVSWVGGLGSNTGSTVAGRTDWALDESDITARDFGAAYVDVDTKNNRFRSVPTYFTSFSGDIQVQKASGSVLTLMSTQMVYYPKTTSFRVYVTQRTTPSTSNIGAMHLKPAFMNDHRWTIGWIGMESAGPANTPSPQWDLGSGDLDWQQNGPDHVYLDVKPRTPKLLWPGYITQITADHMHWQVGGGGSIYGPSSTGFRLYMKGEETGTKVFAKTAHFFKFKVNYISFPADWETPCVVSGWGEWSTCSLACGSGHQSRAKTILQPHSDPHGWGQKVCPALNMTRLCNTQTCGTLHRTRLVVYVNI
jgi:hypothetical protein